MRTETGNLLEAKEKYIAHQCNCVTNRAAHLADAVFRRFPHANVYRDRQYSGRRDMPGTIDVRGDESINQRLVINMFAQLYPGYSKYPNDSYEKRREWFRQCLDKIKQISGLESIAFPEGIGCGAAGASWPEYRDLLEQFQKQCPHVDVVVYRYTE